MHPLSSFKSGSPRAQIHNLYFGGYYWVRLAGRGRLAIAYRPTDVPLKNAGDGLHMTFYQR